MAKHFLKISSTIYFISVSYIFTHHYVRNKKKTNPAGQKACPKSRLTGLEPAIFGAENQRLTIRPQPQTNIYSN